MSVEIQASLRFLWLEITGRCQLACEHCYAESGPTGTHGSMSQADWLRVIDEAAELGVGMVQFIGGEPTLHPDLSVLVRHALSGGMDVEVFSNLVRITPELWETFGLPGVRLATSYYSPDAREHDEITQRRHSHDKTLTGIAEAMRRDIPLRVGIIGLRDGQKVEDACDELVALGVVDVKVDHLRQVGRGVRDRATAVDELCGRCADGVLAVSPDGEAWPCVFARWLPVGNVRAMTLAAVAFGPAVRAVRRELDENFAARPTDDSCRPHCTPNADCNADCNPSCRPQKSSVVKSRSRMTNVS